MLVPPAPPSRASAIAAVVDELGRARALIHRRDEALAAEADRSDALQRMLGGERLRPG